MRSQPFSARYFLLAPAFLLLLVASGAMAQQNPGADQHWDVTKPRGETRIIDFSTDVGTWMSVDVSPDGSFIVFDLLGHIYRIDSTGGEAVSLTQDSGIAMNYHPVISPDGREIAFVSDRQGQDNLWVMRADGSSPEPVWIDLRTRVVEPAWMPDGKAVVVTHRTRTQFGFYRTNDSLWSYPRDGSDPEPVSPATASQPSPGDRFSGAPRWQWASPSQDGKTIYFNSSAYAGDNRQLQRINLDSGEIQQITEPKQIHQVAGRSAFPLLLGEAAPEISPDGRWLAFARKIPGAYLEHAGHKQSGRTALWLRDLETGQERVLMDPITDDQMLGHPSWKTRVLPGYSWTSDGTAIVISQGGRIRRVEIDSGAVSTIPFKARVYREITQMTRSSVVIDDQLHEPRVVRDPATSADGKSLLFEAAGSIWIKPLPEGKPKRLTNGHEGRFERMARWADAGESVIYVTSDGAGSGHVWKVSAEGGESIRLSDSEGIYAFPYPVPGSNLVAVSQWPPALIRVPEVNDDQWQVITLPRAANDEPGPVKTGTPVDVGVGSNGRFYLTRPSGASLFGSAGESQLVSFAADGTDRQVLATVKGPAQHIVPSSDGKHLAISIFQDVYLVATPADPAQVIDVLEERPQGIRRLSQRGGVDPHWLSNSVVEFASSNRHMTHDLVNGTTVASKLGLRVPRVGGKGRIALTNARIISLGAPGVVENGTLVVEDSRIACVGRCTTKGAGRVIDASGKTLIPGFVDTHSHHLREDELFTPVKRERSAIYLAYGVTTVHDPATGFESSFAIRDLVESGGMVGPRSYATGLIIMCVGEGFDAIRRLNTYQDAWGEVNRRADYGAISLKDYKQCTRTQRQWLSEAARERGITLTSENGDLFYVIGLVLHGITGWEHPLEYNPVYGDVTRLFGKAGAHHSIQFFAIDYPHAMNLDYWVTGKDHWKNDKLGNWVSWPRLASRRAFGPRPVEEMSMAFQAENARAMAEEGAFVTMGAHGEVDGLGMHFETWSYGLAATPLQALTSASLHGAHFLGLDRETGSLEKGKLADLMVLDANPLDDLRNTERIRYVMKAGVLYDASTLDEVWPNQKSYGHRPWALDGIRRQDTRSDDYWDKQ
jgi:Tol biopolymer transport system component/imidazolonepropionase-like amidohydrolase